MTKRLVVVQLYPDQMNIYGDNGNAQIVCRRAQLYGYEPRLLAYNSRTDLDNLLKADLVVGGGGQDSGQRAILADLAKIKNDLLSMAAEKVPMLMICGLYQLFGYYFRTKDGDKLDGIGLFDLVTNGSDRRLIGNAIVESDEFGELIGYENHSGITKLNDNQAALGQIVQGYGNDGSGSDEGAMRYCAVGTYLLLGAVGLPVFAGFSGGIGVLLGATGGYLLGFLLTTLVVWLAEIALGTSQPVFLASALVGQGLCYLFGSVWYALGYAGGTAGLPAVLSTCVLPFLLPDTAKLILAWSLRKRLAPVLAKSY